MPAEAPGTRDEFVTKAKVLFNQCPADHAPQHERIEFWDRMMVLMSSVPGLTDVANRRDPAILNEYPDFPIDLVPLLDDDHPRAVQRMDQRNRYIHSNMINAAKRHNLVMDLRTALFASIYLCVEKNNPIFSRLLIEKCDYSRHCSSAGGHFDGSLAYNLLHVRLFGASRKKQDVKFYDTAKDIQAKSKLPDGCRASDFETRAHAWIFKIRPHLRQTYADEDAAEFIMDMIPKRVGADARRIKAELQREGTFTNLVHLTEQLKDIIYDDQNASPATPGLFTLDAGLSTTFNITELSEACGVALAAPGGRGGGRLNGAFAATDGKKWCDKCPHVFNGKERPCICDPYAEMQWPVSLHDQAERKKELLAKKVKNAREAGVTAAKMTNPSAEAIAAYKKRAAKAARGRGKPGTPAGLSADAPPSTEASQTADGAAVAAASVEQFFAGLTDLSLPAISVPPADGQFDDADGEGGGEQPLADAEDGVQWLGDECELFWYVVGDAGGLRLQCLAGTHDDVGQLNLTAGSSCISFGTDEAAARAHLFEAESNAPAQGEQPPTQLARPPVTPSPSMDLHSSAPSSGSNLIQFQDDAIAPPPPLPNTASLVSGLGGAPDLHVAAQVKVGQISPHSALFTSNDAKMGDHLGIAPPPPIPMMSNNTEGSAATPPRPPIFQTPLLTGQSRTAARMAPRTGQGGQPYAHGTSAPASVTTGTLAPVAESGEIRPIGRQVKPGTRFSTITNEVDSPPGGAQLVVGGYLIQKRADGSVRVGQGADGSSSAANTLAADAESPPYRDYAPPAPVKRCAAGSNVPLSAQVAMRTQAKTSAAQIEIAKPIRAAPAAVEAPDGGNAARASTPSDGAGAAAPEIRGTAAVPSCVSSQEGSCPPKLKPLAELSHTRADTSSPEPHVTHEERNPSEHSVSAASIQRASAMKSSGALVGEVGPRDGAGVLDRRIERLHFLEPIASLTYTQKALMALAAMSLFFMTIAFRYTSNAASSMFVGGAAFGISLDVFHNGAHRLAHALKCLAEFVGFAIDAIARNPISAALIFVLLAIGGAACAACPHRPRDGGRASGSLVFPTTASSNVGRGAALDGGFPDSCILDIHGILSPPPSPPPSRPSSPPPRELSGSTADHYGDLGLKQPRADWLTAGQADTLFLELLAGNEQPPDLPECARKLIIGDTGCGRSMGCHDDHFEPNSCKKTNSSVIGVSGSMPITECGDLRIPLQTISDGVRCYRESGGLKNKRCPFVLLALGRASLEQGVSMNMPPWGADCVFEWPNGVAVKLFNRHVLVVRPIGYKESPNKAVSMVSFETLGIPDEGEFGLYIASGELRQGDIRSHLLGHITLVCIDTKIGGATMNLLNPELQRTLMFAAAETRCVIVIESLDCKTWSAALFDPDLNGNPGRPMRDAHHIEGIPLPDGTLPRRVRDANIMTVFGAELGIHATAHGARFLSETPAARGDGQGGLVTPAAPTDGLVGAERHVYMYDHRSWKELLTRCGATIHVVDQCRWADHDPCTVSEKATAIFTCREVTPTALKVLCDEKGVGLRCDHPAGTHHSLKGFRTAGSEAYSSRFCLALAVCVWPSLADDVGLVAGGSFGEFALVAGVIYGKRLKRDAVTSTFIHNTWGHAERRCLIHLKDALCDIEPFWAEVCEDVACDVCLRGEAPKMGARGHLPEVTGLWFVDVHHVQVPTLWYGEKSTIGFKHSVSKLCRTWRGRKSQAPDVFELFFAWTNSNGHPCTWIHCDQADDLKGSKIVPIVRKHACRITTTTVNSSNQNPIEPSWRVLTSKTRRALINGSMPLEFWGYAWDDCEEAMALTPSRDPPHECPLGRFLGEKPPGTHRRPPFCLCYPTVAPRLPNGTLVNKMASQAPRAILLGYFGGRCGSFERLGIDRTQPGWGCYIPSDDNSVGRHHAGTIVVTPHVRFVPDCFPGLQRCKGGGWRIPTSKIPFITEGSRVPEGTPENIVNESDEDEAEAPSGEEPSREASSANTTLPDGVKEINDDETLDGVPTTNGAFDYDSFEVRRGFDPDQSGDPPETPPRQSTDSTPEPSDNTPEHEPPLDNPPPTPKATLIIPSSHWPDEECTEHDGQGWEVSVVRRLGRWALCRFVNATTDDGHPFEDVWRPINTLITVTPLTASESTGDKSSANEGPPSPITGREPQESNRQAPIDLTPEAMRDITILTPPSGANGPSPNHDTIPPTPGADPLKEPARPSRSRQPPDRFTVGAIAASHVELDKACRNGEPLHVDVGQLSERLAEHLSLSALEGFDLTTNVAELDFSAQRAICLLADHDHIAAELGGASPQAALARKLYAAAALDAARDGFSLPPLEPVLSAFGALPPSRRSTPDFHTALCGLPSIFDSEHDGRLFVHDTRGIDETIICAAKKKSSPEIFSEREMRGREWDAPKQVEMGKLDRLGAMTPIAADDPMLIPILNRTPVVDTMWAGRIKYNADLTIDKYSARCVLRGDIHAKCYGIDSNRSMSPVVRNTSCMAIDACAVLRRQHMRPYDITGAYLWGEQKDCEQVVARPPVGFRQYDERGVEIYWLMWVPLYGQTDAGAIWNRTFNAFLTSDSMGYDRCDNDPCVYSKALADGSVLTKPVYVDDGRFYFDPTPLAESTAEEDMKKLAGRFEVKYQEVDPIEDYFLGGNRLSGSPDACTISCYTYIDKMAKRYLEHDVSEYPSSWAYTPADETLVRAHEEATASRLKASPDFTTKYGSLFGALLHAIKYRPEISIALNLCGSCLTFPTEKLYNHLVRVLVYLVHTRTMGTTYTNKGENKKLHAFADSNWSTTRSTTGYVVFLGNAAIAHAARRQHCITMSSCEAELVALADLSIELLYISSLLAFIGYEHEGPIGVSTDNKGAYDLCHRFTSAANSRHVDRKLFKMRELRGAGVVTVAHVPTEFNPADLFTKVLGRQDFEKHRRTVLNLAAAEGVQRQAYEARAKASASGEISSNEKKVKKKKMGFKA